MSITTLAQLKTAIANWINRSDLTSYLEDFVTLGQARLNRQLRLIQMETTANVSVSDAASTASLPTGFLDIITLHHSDTYELLTQITPHERQRLYTSGEGRPSSYAISTTFLFECPSDQAYTLSCRYFKRLDLVNDLTNWLLTNSPDTYLYASLLEAAAFSGVDDDERIPLWEGRLNRCIVELNTLDAKVRSRAGLRVDDGLLATSLAYDINTDG